MLAGSGERRPQSDDRTQDKCAAGLYGDNRMVISDYDDANHVFTFPVSAYCGTSKQKGGVNSTIASR
jgi:hypothetical protein